MPSVVYVAGARPNFMKIAPILKAANGGPFERVLVHTGQHYDYAMSGVFFEQLGIAKPDVHLEVGSAGHGVQTGRIMATFEEYLLGRAEPPKGIVVVGDVNSTMACALVGAKLGIPVAHVEAGLRSFDRTMPEELNRVVTDAVSDLLLVSEPSGLENLAREGIPSERVHYVGNVMIDTLVEQLPAARALDMPARVGVRAGDYAVVTLHRPSNVDEPRRLATLVALLERMARDVPVVFPVHPRTDTRLRTLGLLDRLVGSAQVKVIAPLGYREFLGLLAAARVVVTDSGGIQEETTYLKVPCITLRTTTERPSTVTTGSNILVGEDIEATDAAVRDLVTKAPRACGSVEGWDGNAAPRIQRVFAAAWS
jgi:UDP-N-acetylglucosamine 2-epimerase (non-hydrolysing)